MASFNSAISVCLVDSDIYAQYYPWMEMMCREQSYEAGKKIFPEMAFEITGLESEKQYEVFLSFERLGNKRYTYDKKENQWKVSGEQKKVHVYKKMSIGSKSGDEWMQEPFAVPEARITNNLKNDKKEKFYLTPLHKYVPVIYIRDTETCVEKRFVVEKAQFLPVTTPYNQELKAWKAANDKFSTCRNNGPGKPLKRKAMEEETRSPEAKRPALMDTNPPMFRPTPPHFPSFQATDNNGYNQYDTWYPHNPLAFFPPAYPYRETYNYSGYPMAQSFSMNTVYPIGYPDQFPHQIYNENLLPFPTYPTQFTNFY